MRLRLLWYFVSGIVVWGVHSCLVRKRALHRGPHSNFSVSKFLLPCYGPLAFLDCLGFGLNCRDGFILMTNNTHSGVVSHAQVQLVQKTLHQLSKINKYPYLK